MLTACCLLVVVCWLLLPDGCCCLAGVAGWGCMLCAVFCSLVAVRCLVSGVVSLNSAVG